MAIYLIKINVALMLLYGFYLLTVSRDTFFGLRRLTLWLIYAVALMVPALNLEYWVRDTPTMASMANVYADTFYPVVVVKAQAPSITWMDMLLGIYWAGVAVLSLSLVWQLFSIIRLAVISRKQEVRMNLKYLADESVLSDGNARKSYQYHLLGLAYRQPKDSTKIANNFNLLPLKKRIKMMNKRRTSEIGKAKYLLFAPLAGALLMVSNIESVAREIGEQIPEVAEVQQKAEQALNTDVAVANPMAEEAKAAAEAKKAEEAKTAELAKSEAELKAEAKASDATAPTDTTKNVVYDVTETMPQFPGGQGVMMKYLAANIKYPASAVKAKKQGRVIVSFVIQKDGSVTNARIVRSVDSELDAEALRIVKAMPNWTPGTQDGKPVNVRYTIPVVFSLYKDVTPRKEVK